MQWFRLYHEWAHDPKVQMLGYDTQRHMVMLMCMHSEGLVTETTNNDEVAFYLRVTVTEAETLHETLQPRFLKQNTWILNAWNERQLKSDHSTERVRKHRENKKKLEKRECNVTETALTEQKEKKKNIKKEKPEPPLFGEFWSAYPRKVAKPKARAAFEVATRKAEPEDVVAGAKAYAAQVRGKDPEFIAHPSTWLNGERWNDFDDTPPKGTVDEQLVPWAGMQ